MYYFIKILVKLGLHAYHKKIEVHGLEHVPKDKPVIFLPNHQSALLDVLLIVVDCNRKPFFLTRADVFGKPFLDAIFKFFRMIPIYRIRDGKSALAKNDAIFDTCAAVLNNKEALVMFPEANHNLKRRVRPLSKGFTRILFRAKEKYPDLDIQLVPVGLNYKNATNFPDEVALYYGESIALNAIYDKTNAVASTKRIKEMVSERLQGLTTHIASETNYDAIRNHLDGLGVDYLKPKEVNKLILNYSVENKEPSPSNAQQKNNFFYALFVLLNFPVVLVWKRILKPKVWEPEFMGTLRFATAIVGCLVYCTVLLILLTILYRLDVALLVTVALGVFNWIYVKYLSP